jgi:hypothetical protein
MGKAHITHRRIGYRFRCVMGVHGPQMLPNCCRGVAGAVDNYILSYWVKELSMLANKFKEYVDTAQVVPTQRHLRTYL